MHTFEDAYMNTYIMLFNSIFNDDCHSLFEFNDLE